MHELSGASSQLRGRTCRNNQTKKMKTLGLHLPPVALTARSPRHDHLPPPSQGHPVTSLASNTSFAVTRGDCYIYPLGPRTRPNILAV
jgi:hypothetical protein